MMRFHNTGRNCRKFKKCKLTLDSGGSSFINETAFGRFESSSSLYCKLFQPRVSFYQHLELSKMLKINYYLNIYIHPVNSRSKVIPEIYRVSILIYTKIPRVSKLNPK
jgi:hypothetical protein